MKNFFIGLLFLSSVSAFATDPLELTDFKIVKDSSTALTLKYQDQFEFIISKARFANERLAVSFCKSNKSKLDSDFNSLLIAMSGAANVNKFLNDTITFKFQKDVTGIWQWRGKNNDIIQYMLDGRGTELEEVSVKELSEERKVALPAICVSKL